MTDNPVDANLIDLTADIVSAYVSNNTVASTDLPSLINEVHSALQKTASASSEPEPEPLKPAVPVKKSVMPDYIICLEDGKKFKSLKRHLRTHYNMTRKSTGTSGTWVQTIRWLRRTMLQRGRNWRRKWALASSASVPNKDRDPSMVNQTN